MYPANVMPALRAEGLYIFFMHTRVFQPTTCRTQVSGWLILDPLTGQLAVFSLPEKGKKKLERTSFLLGNKRIRALCFQVKGIFSTILVEMKAEKFLQQEVGKKDMCCICFLFYSELLLLTV